MKGLFKLLLTFAAGTWAVRRLRRSRSSIPSPTAPPTPHRHRRRRLLVRATVAGLVLAVGGFLVAASGVISIKASSGHWAITEWFLHFSMKRSVATHSLGLDAPPLDDERLVVWGAGHYETGCRPCHGGPDVPQPRIAAKLTPAPPYLPPTIGEWEAEELFYIVKHGVKFTGMPAWPARERDDEVWAMVAFLLALPDLDGAAYRRLVHGPTPSGDASAPLEDLLEPATVPEAVTQSCGRCHGDEGQGRGLGAFPKLAGQREAYLLATLQAFARGERPSGVMEPVAAALDPAELRALARYFAALPSPPTPTAQDAEAATRGRRIALEGIASEGVPACADCHGPAPFAHNDAYPRLDGQYAAYLVNQLTLFKSGRRGGTAYSRLMKPAVHNLTPEQMQAVAAFYAGLGDGVN